MAGQSGAEPAARRGENYAGLSRPQRAADRRERITAAALHLFATHEYSDVTIADVCARAKVAKRYFYDHFADRAELLLALHREQNDWLLSGVAAAAPERPAGVEALLRPVMGCLVAMLADNPERARVVYIATPRMERRRRGVLRSDAEMFGRLIRRQLGQPRDEQLFDRLVLALVAGVTEVVIDWLNRDMSDDADVLAEHLTRLGTAILARLE